jgi:hypothetical protein
MVDEYGVRRIEVLQSSSDVVVVRSVVIDSQK